MKPETYKINFAGAVLTLELDHRTCADLLAAAGQPPLQIPPGCNTVHCLFQTAEGKRALMVNQGGFAPQASDNEEPVNGYQCAIIEAPEMSDDEAAEVLNQWLETQLAHGREMDKWQTAQMTAERNAAAILEQIAQATQQHGQAPKLVPLSNYPTAEDFIQIQGEATGWTWKQWKMVNQATSRILRRHKLKTRLIDLTASEYFAWLEATGQKNTPASRASYISLKGAAQ